MRNTLTLLAIGFLWVSPPLWAAETDVAAVETKRVTLKWLGNTGWEIQVGETKILIDPFLTRKEPTAGKEWQTDEEAVLKVITAANYIFAGHSHADHIGDVPFIAKRFGSKVIGSRTTTNIALTGGVAKEQLTTIGGGENLNFNGFAVQVIKSAHGELRRAGRWRQPKSEEIVKPWDGPIMGNHFVEGGSYLYCFTFGSHRVLHQSTGNFIEGNLHGLQPEVALLAATGNYDFTDAVKILRPKTVVIHHFDEWRAPFSSGIPAANRKRARRVEQQVKSVDGNIKVIIPDFLQTITLE